MFRLVETPGQTPVCQNDNNTNDEDNELDNYRFGIPNGTHSYDALTIDTTEYHPYTPGFATKKLYGQDDDGYDAVSTCYSAGVDCSGFMQRSASYAENPYDDNDGNIWDNNMNTLPEARNIWAAAYPGRPLEGVNGFNTSSWEIPDEWANLLIPGDIVYMDGHVSLVWKINYLNNSRTVTRLIVDTIESAYNDGAYKVCIDRTWSDLHTIRTTTIKRLRTR